MNGLLQEKNLSVRHPHKVPMPFYI